MKYYSTNDDLTHPVSLHDAVLRSIAPDGGVYMPGRIPLIPRALFNNIPDMSLTDIAYIAATTMFGSDIAAETLNNIVKDTLTFDIPLHRVDDNIYALELFHGPTGSFKDIGARFMARIVSHLLKQEGSARKLNVVVATSGDTGSAVGNGFAGVDGVNVYILHPKGKLLRVPHESFRSPAKNIIPIGVRGTFDDCQQLVRQIYADEELNRQISITSANSINIARLLPQTFYYFHAYARLLALGVSPEKIVVSTPCGNLGNLTAALFSCQMGLPLNRIIAAGYSNERLWGNIAPGGGLTVNEFNSRALSTNLARINSLIKVNPDMGRLIECQTFADTDVAQTIVDVYFRSGYPMDRNTSMACGALLRSIRSGETGVFFATAAPQKYAAKLRQILGVDLFPQSAEEHHAASSRGVSEPTISPFYPALKRFLLDNN